MFIWLAAAIVLLSGICSFFGVSEINPVTNKSVQVVNLFSKQGLVRMLTEFVNNFTGIPALGLTLTCMLGVGIAENAGFFHAALRGLANSKGSDLKVIAIFVFACVMADCTGGGRIRCNAAFGGLNLGFNGAKPNGWHVSRLCVCVWCFCLEPHDHVHGRH